MELFTTTNVVKLRSHLDKYLLAGDDGETIRQSSEGGSSHKAKWFVEIVDGNSNRIRLKSTRGKYLMASNIPFLLGMTGKKVIQTSPERVADWKLEWEPIRDGFQTRLRSRCGTFLRANGGTPPWRNTVTHDDPLAGATQRWTLWDVEAVAVVATESMVEYLSSLSSFSSISNEVLEAAFDDGYGSESVSPMSVVSSLRSPRLTVVKSMSPRLSPPRKISSDHFPSGMEFFQSAKAVRLRSHHDKYLVAEEDEESATQDRNGSSRNAKWTVEVVPGQQPILRFKSCYGKYLTATNQPFLLGMTGRKVLQTLPRRLDSSVEWEPIREGYSVKLKTRYGNFLRANGGLPPWRNSVTHDIPHRTATQEWVLWHVDIIDIRSSDHQDKTSPPVSHLDSLDFEDSSPSSISGKSDNFSRQESTDSNVSFPPKLEGRTIYYHVGDESSGEVDEDVENGDSFHFRGKGIDELTQKLREETGLQDIVACTRNPLNGKLYPLRLQLPPNNADLHVFVVPSSSKVARDFE